MSKDMAFTSVWNRSLEYYLDRAGARVDSMLKRANGEEEQEECQLPRFSCANMILELQPMVVPGYPDNLDETTCSLLEQDFDHCPCSTPKNFDYSSTFQSNQSESTQWASSFHSSAAPEKKPDKQNVSSRRGSSRYLQSPVTNAPLRPPVEAFDVHTRTPLRVQRNPIERSFRTISRTTEVRDDLVQRLQGEEGQSRLASRRYLRAPVLSKKEQFRLQVEPRERAVFGGPLLGKKPVSIQMQVANPTRKPCAFKVRCTSNELFKIRPPVGVLGPNATIHITLTLNARRTVPESGKHFVTIYSTVVSDKDDEDNVLQIWEDHRNDPASFKRIFLDFEREQTDEG